MQKLLTYICLGLLFFFTFGVSSNFLPLCSISDVEVEHAKFEHHEHIKDISEAHDHALLIEHGEHFDEGFFDLILCYLTEQNHHGETVKIDISSPQIIAQVFLLAAIICFVIVLPFFFVQRKSGKSYFYLTRSIYTPPDRLTPLFRGPPALV